MENDAGIEGALAFLQKTPSHGGVSVFEHLTDVVAKILEDQPADAVDLLETSLLVKRTAEPDSDEQTLTILAEQDECYVKRAEEKLKLLSVQEPEIDPSTGEVKEITPPNECECEDIVHNGHLLRALGVNLSEEELHDITLMSQLLGADPSFQIASIRFFGKFFGLKQIYYIFETSLKEQLESGDSDPQGEEEIPMEIGSGANAHVYYTCHFVGDEFIRLPDVNPSQIKAARNIRRFLTGNLESEVSAYPPFPGKEAEYLRCQIARITASTQLSPVGIFSVNEEGTIEKSEEPTIPTSEDLKNFASWCHLSVHLKQQGRCALHVREAPENEDAEFKLRDEEKEEGPELLTTIENDAAMEWGHMWTPLSSHSNPYAKHIVSGMRSNLWPGAFAAAKGVEFVNVYIGWGIKAGNFQPHPFPPISSECTSQLKEHHSLPAKPAELQDTTESQEQE